MRQAQPAVPSPLFSLHGVGQQKRPATYSTVSRRRLRFRCYVSSYNSDAVPTTPPTPPTDHVRLRDHAANQNREEPGSRVITPHEQGLQPTRRSTEHPERQERPPGVLSSATWRCGPSRGPASR